jgi:hypothetical protein
VVLDSDQGNGMEAALPSVDALRAYFDGREDDRQTVVARVHGSLGAQAAEVEHRRLAEVRANWRT